MTVDTLNLLIGEIKKAQSEWLESYKKYTKKDIELSLLKIALDHDEVTMEEYNKVLEEARDAYAKEMANRFTVSLLERTWGAESLETEMRINRDKEEHDLEYLTRLEKLR
jgi:hypothetical protein